MRIPSIHFLYLKHGIASLLRELRSLLRSLYGCLAFASFLAIHGLSDLEDDLLVLTNY